VKALSHRHDRTLSNSAPFSTSKITDQGGEQEQSDKHHRGYSAPSFIFEEVLNVVHCAYCEDCIGEPAAESGNGLPFNKTRVVQETGNSREGLYFRKLNTLGPGDDTGKLTVRRSELPQPQHASVHFPVKNLSSNFFFSLPTWSVTSLNTASTHRF
jgi:hypothetical protein